MATNEFEDWLNSNSDVESSVTAASDTAVSQEDVDELAIYIANDGRLYEQITTPIIKNMKRKRRNGNYDDALAVKGWQHLADEGVRRYDKEFGSGKGSITWLNKATRTAIAEELKEYYEEEISYDDSVNSSADISAGVDTNRNSSNRFNTTVENDSEYLTALADGVINERNTNYGDAGELIYSISEAAITFSLDSEVVYIQPVDRISPDWDDLDDDIEELYESICSAVISQF